MRTFLLLTLLLFSPLAVTQTQDPNCNTVCEQLARNDYGNLFIRVANYLPRYVSCYYRDDYNYLTFNVAPQSVTLWQPVYGTYVWECE